MATISRTRDRNHRSRSQPKFPVATWVDRDTKRTIYSRWAWLGLRSEAAYIRSLIEEDLEKNPPPATK